MQFSFRLLLIIFSINLTNYYWQNELFAELYQSDKLIEAEEVTGLPLKDVENASSVFASLLQKKFSTVILTLGSKGALFQRQNENSYTHVPARTVKAIDSTGAGDAFMGTLVYFLAYHSDKSLQDIIQKSCEVATLSVLRKGTQASFPGKEDLPLQFFD